MPATGCWLGKEREAWKEREIAEKLYTAEFSQRKRIFLFLLEMFRFGEMVAYKNVKIRGKISPQDVQRFLKCYLFFMKPHLF